MHTGCLANENQLFQYDPVTKRIQLTRRDTDNCIDYNTGNSNVYTHQCHDGANQKFTYNTTTMQIVSDHDGKCMDTAPGNNYNVYMNTCMTGNGNQKFAPPSGAGFPAPSETLIASPDGSLCMDSSPEWSNNIYMYSDCDGANNNQLWKYDPATKRIELTHREDDNCMDYNTGNSNLVAHACTSNMNQKFTYNATTMQIVSDLDGKCMDTQVTDKNLYMNTCMTDNENQQFYPFSGAGFFTPSA
jgi:hypothetical protein